MKIIFLFAAIAVAALLLARLPDLRAVLVAAVLSSVAAGLWLAALPWLPTFGARILSAAPTQRALVEFVLGAIVITVAQTIVPNLLVLGGMRRWLRALRAPRAWGVWSASSAEPSLWTALTAGVLVVPVGIVYGQLVLVATLAMWSFVVILSDRAVVAAHALQFLLVVPEIQGMAAVGGITAIGVQAAIDRKVAVARRAGTERA